MSRPTSFRLAEELRARLDERASALGISVAALVATLLDEGLKTSRFPGVVYRDGPAGRRAGLVGGPDVWEVVRELRTTPGRGERRLANLAEELGQPISRVRLAIDFYATHPDEIDERVALDERMASRLREVIDRREGLMSM